MIKNIIDVLQGNEHYGAGKYTEIAKGKYEYVSTWNGFKRKAKRLWQSLKR